CLAVDGHRVLLGQLILRSRGHTERDSVFTLAAFLTRPRPPEGGPRTRAGPARGRVVRLRGPVIGTELLRHARPACCHGTRWEPRARWAHANGSDAQCAMRSASSSAS